ncbi:MAG: hypothetical protein PF445_02210 [Melioribacteraceae bacterium]|jgi:YVTN family beta-propeller protein|nr:hypothetical protein [Melioribacteraceae bacterium]
MKQIFITRVLLFAIVFMGCEDTIVDPPVENSSKTLYVINQSAQTLSKVNLTDSSITKDIVEIGLFGNKIKIYEERIYVVTSGEDNIKVVDPKDDTNILQIIGLDAGSNPWDITFASTDKAYISNWITNTVSVIDLVSGTVVKNIEVGKAPEGIIYKDGKVYVTNTGYAGWGQPFNNSSVSIIEVAEDRVIGTISTPINPQDLAFAPDGKLHVLCTGDYATSFGTIAIIDVDSQLMIDSVFVGGSPGDIEITNAGIGYCSAWGDGVNGFLCAYDTESKLVYSSSEDPIRVGPNVSQIVYDYQENVLWIPYMSEWAGDGFIQKFDVTTNTVTWTSDVVGNGTSAVAIYEYTE